MTLIVRTDSRDVSATCSIRVKMEITIQCLRQELFRQCELRRSCSMAWYKVREIHQAG